MGYIRSSPLPEIEVKSSCPSCNIKCHWLTGKFLLKSLSQSNSLIFDFFYSLFLTWRYVPKILPILSLNVNSISPFHEYIITNIKHPIYDINPSVLRKLHLVNLFPGFTSSELRVTSSMVINNLFSDFIENNFVNFTVVYTDGSVYPFWLVILFIFPHYIFHLQVIHSLPLLPSQLSVLFL